MAKRRTLLAVMSLSSVCLANSPAFAQKSIEYEKEQLRAYERDIDSDSIHTTANYLRAEQIKLAAIRLYDRLPKDNPNRIGAHKSFALWYMLFKKDSEAARETKILSELMGTTDEKILFPKYLGCGSYENKKLAQLCGTG